MSQESPHLWLWWNIWPQPVVISGCFIIIILGKVKCLDDDKSNCLCCSCWNAVLNVTRALIAYMPLSLVCLGVLHTLYRCMFGNFANNMKGYICYKKFEVWKASQPLVCDEASRAFCIHPLYPCYSLHTPVVGAHAGAVLDVYFNCDSPVYCHILLIITLCQVPSCKASTFAHFAKYSTGIYIYTLTYISWHTKSDVLWKEIMIYCITAVIYICLKIHHWSLWVDLDVSGISYYLHNQHF